MRKDNMDTNFLKSLNFYIISTLILLSKRCGGAHYKYEACEPKNCSHGPNISYPFRISGTQPDYCGYPKPGFSLICGGHGFPVLQLPENIYVVEDIFYETRLIHLYYAAVLESNDGPCVPRIRNTTIPVMEFSFERNLTYLYLFSGCRKPFPEALLRYNISCDNISSNWDLALYDTDENWEKAREICARNVAAPVESDNGDEGSIGIARVKEVLRRGFVLHWFDPDCSGCEESGGRCGFEPVSFRFMCFCTDRPHSVSCPNSHGKRLFRKILLIVGVTMTALTTTSIVLLLLIWKKRTLLILLGFEKETAHQNEKYIESFLKNNGNLAPRRYRHSDLKKMTNSFCGNLGKGGYGCVYKGKLPDGRLVAVKILNESKGNGEEFMNEVASISRTSHVNIVALLGFCFEGSKRALIYEFMPNGSLEKFIQYPTSSSVEIPLGWEKLFEIAVGIAQGLDYLHRGCNMRIVHFDIKPHNILLDKDFNPKISDFGLAKLCPDRSNTVSMLVARGTIGYIAPEVVCTNFGGVSHKSDVYSYGVMVLEIAGGTKNMNAEDVDGSSEMHFPQCVYTQLETMDAENLDGINAGEDERQIAKRKLLTVGLWCVQTDPKDRPSMSKVVEMLEGGHQFLQIPPKPYLSSPPKPMPDLFSIF